MTKTELTAWFDDIFWPLYKQFVVTPFVTKWKQGPAGDALKKILTLNPSSDLREQITTAIHAQMHHRRALYEKCGSMRAYDEATKYNKLYSNRLCTTWLNQMGWRDEIPSISEVQTEAPSTEEKCKHCGSPCHGPAYDVCILHISMDENGRLTKHRYYKELAEYYVKHPEIHGMKNKQAVEFIKQKLRSLGQ